MGVIDKVREKRKKLAEVLAEEDGLRGILKDKLYPDAGHFIYELLQNAEDTEATEVEFILSQDRLVFEHNGRPFNEADIYGVTGLGQGTKEDDKNTIGRFGIGFKSVFSITETPRIWSPQYSFKITGMVLPEEIPGDPELGSKTRFEFPFDSKRKSRDAAHSEIWKGLTEISPETLLFLSHISSIRWEDEDGIGGDVRRVCHSDLLIEISAKTDAGMVAGTHFFRVREPVEEFPTQNVSVAFLLSPLSGDQPSMPSGDLAKHFEIIPANPGQVAAFFVAKSESSGLRFHVHAPFMTDISRASLRETDENLTLFEALGKCAANALEYVRDHGLLTVPFLEALPNSQDAIAPRYTGIRDAIVTAMKEKPLTPKHGNKGHAAANNLRQAKGTVKRVLSTEDLNRLAGGDRVIPIGWAAASNQRNSNSDRFLSTLEIEAWDFDEFWDLLSSNLSPDAYEEYNEETEESEEGPHPDTIDWLAGKTDAWHQRLYALLYRELELDDLDEYVRGLDELCIVRGEEGQYLRGEECYFRGAEEKLEGFVTYVAAGTHTGGTNKAEKKAARKALEACGVRDVGEEQEIEAILSDRYSLDAHAHPSLDVYAKDLARFIEFVNQNPEKADLFGGFHIFHCDRSVENGGPGWLTPEAVYLDSPDFPTGLFRYFEQEDAQPPDLGKLSPMYKDLPEQLKESFIVFCETVGVRTTLPISEASCSKNPDWDSTLRHVPGTHITWTGHDRDYKIIGLRQLLELPSETFSRTVWRTMEKEWPYKRLGLKNVLKASYSMNESSGEETCASQLAHVLEESRWIPQGEDRFATPAEASRELLPGGFDTDWDDYYTRWTEELNFGRDESSRLAREKAVREGRARKLEFGRELGIDSEEKLESTEWLMGLSERERQSLKLEHQARSRASIDDLHAPDRPEKNRDQRSERTRAQAKKAPRKETDYRERSIAVGQEETKEQAREYLRGLYTTPENVMICQVCNAELPFTMPDGKHYFEAMVFLEELELQHHQNYLALCPNHGAMFKHANEHREYLKQLFMKVPNEALVLEANLAGEKRRIRFLPDHFEDLRSVIEAEEGGETD